MQRRTCWFIATLVLSVLAAPFTAREGKTQSAGKVYRVGVVLAGSSPLAPGSFGQVPAQRAFLDRLANHGYVEGQNLVIEPRRGTYDRLAELAAELVRLKVDVIFTSGTKTSRIVAEAVTTTPIVMFSCDPFEHVARLARPDANLTGVTCMTTELSPKRLELLREAVPKASRVVFLSDPDDAPGGLKVTQDAAPPLRITLRRVDVKSDDAVQHALSAVAAERADALFVYPNPLFFAWRDQLAEFGLKHRLPTMHAFREFVDAGGLMSYGASIPELFAVAADQVAKILQGTRPSELPVRQATRFELVINMKTARALGLTIPQQLLQRADQVIE